MNLAPPSKRDFLFAALILAALVAALLFFLPRLAAAQVFTTPGCLAKVAPLAKRLHVKPNPQGAVVVIGCDNKQYDLLAMVAALLDRLDTAEKKTR